jgi:hypothetical protein
LPEDREAFWHVGVVVEDVDRAAREFGELLSIEFTQSRDAPAVHSRVSFGYGTPPMVELLEHWPGGPYDDPALGPRVDHLAVWAEELERDTDRLVEQGLELETWFGPGLGAHLRCPASGIRIALHDPDNRDRIYTELWHTRVLPGSCSRIKQPMAGVTAVVADLDLAMKELSLLLGDAFSAETGKARVDLVETDDPSSPPGLRSLDWWATDPEVEQTRFADIDVRLLDERLMFLSPAERALERQT